MFSKIKSEFRKHVSNKIYYKYDNIESIFLYLTSDLILVFFLTPKTCFPLQSCFLNKLFSRAFFVSNVLNNTHIHMQDLNLINYILNSFITIETRLSRLIKETSYFPVTCNVNANQPSAPSGPFLWPVYYVTHGICDLMFDQTPSPPWHDLSQWGAVHVKKSGIPKTTPGIF